MICKQTRRFKAAWREVAQISSSGDANGIHCILQCWQQPTDNLRDYYEGWSSWCCSFCSIFTLYATMKWQDHDHKDMCSLAYQWLLYQHLMPQLSTCHILPNIYTSFPALPYFGTKWSSHNLWSDPHKAEVPTSSICYHTLFTNYNTYKKGSEHLMNTVLNTEQIRTKTELKYGSFQVFMAIVH